MPANLTVFEVSTICRLCLRVDEKVFKLNSKHHKAFIENIIKLKKINDVPTEDHYVCYICNALITKTFNFMQTIWNSQEIICEILKNTDMVTKPMLEDIDRHDNGLNPITLSSVLICDSEINTKIEIEFQDDNKGENMQNQEYKENYNIIKIENLAKNENSPIPICHEGIKETENCYLDEVDVVVSDDPLDGNCTDLRQEFTNDLSMEACEDLKPRINKKMWVCITKSERIKRKRKLRALNKTKDLSSTKKEIKCKKKLADEDYQPDTTSQSEDSEYDSYDDEGRRLRRPQDRRSYPRQCDHCHFEVLQKRDHYRHYQYMHPNVEYPYKYEKNSTCSICGKLMRKEVLNGHERGHITQKLKCTLCPKVFPNSKRRYYHMNNVHPKKTFTCDYCSKIFKTKTDILRHLRIHTGSKPFKCHICGDGFAHSGNVKIHIRSKHQNYKIVPKKQSQKVRGNNKHDSIDAGTTFSNDEVIRSTKKNDKTKKLRKNKNQHENTDMTLKKKNKSERQANRKRKKVVSEDGKVKQRKKKTQMIADHDATNDDFDTNLNIDGNHNNYENAEVDSDDEILIMIKKRKDGENNVG